jgi:hypothetical protein
MLDRRARDLEKASSRDEGLAAVNDVLGEEPVPLAGERGRERRLVAVVARVLEQGARRPRHVSVVDWLDWQGVRRLAGGVARERNHHADLLPCVPVHRDGPRVALRRLLVGEGIEEGVRGRVVDLARQSEHRGHGRKENEELRRIVRENPVEDERTLHLRVDHLGARLLRAQRDQRVAEDARGVKNGANRTESLPHVGDERLGRARIGDIGAHDHDLGAERAHGLHTPDLHGRVIALTMRREICRPRRLGRERRASDQHEPRFSGEGSSEVFGDGQADPAQAARDEADALGSRPSRRRLFELDLVDAPHPTLSATQRDHVLAGGDSELTYETFDELVLGTRGARGDVDVDRDAGDVGKLAWNDAARAVEERAFGHEKIRLTEDGVHTARDHREP